MKTSVPRIKTAMAGACCAVVLGACEEHPVIGIEKIRENGAPVRVGVSTADRFDYSTEKEKAARKANQPSNEELVANMLEWSVPKGWEQLPPRPYRIVNLKAGDVECYVSYISGGGALGNINRWRKQMGLADLAAEELDGLATGKFLKGDAHRVDLSGDFTGFEGEKPGFRMVGVFTQMPAFAMSIKMVGPKDAVGTQVGAFDEFCASLKWKGMDGQGATEGPPGDTTKAGRFTWVVPEGWVEAPSPPSAYPRHITFKMGGKAECYITFLASAAGGLVSNVTRWRGQVGLAPLDAEALAALPRVTILGKPSAMLQALGETDGILATVTALPGETMFVKLTGPKDEVAAQKDKFTAFCESLKEAK